MTRQDQQILHEPLHVSCLVEHAVTRRQQISGLGMGPVDFELGAASLRLADRIRAAAR